MMIINRRTILFTAGIALAMMCLTATSQSVAQAAAEPLTVFVFAGQSNMIGRRSTADKLPEEYQGEQAKVLIFSDNQWLPYRPGLGQKAGFGPEVSAASDLAKALGKPVGIVKHSVGGTNLAKQWNPANPGNLYAAFKGKVAAAAKARPIKIAGAFWMQGGADGKSAEMAEAYSQNLDTLIAAMRRDFDNPTLPFVAGRSKPYLNSRFVHIARVRAAQSEARPNYAWVDLDTITLGPDKIHYDTPGMADFGQRLAVRMQTLLKTQGHMP